MELLPCSLQPASHSSSVSVRLENAHTQATSLASTMENPSILTVRLLCMVLVARKSTSTTTLVAADGDAKDPMWAKALLGSTAMI